EFSLDTIEGKKMSCESNSTTYGFKVPSASIIDHFSDKGKYADLAEEDLMEGGELFPQVLFGNSHQGSAVNLLTNNAEMAAFCDICNENYVQVFEGEENTPGFVYKVEENAAEPFNKVTGKKFTLMSVKPVINSPFVAKLHVPGHADFAQMLTLFTSDKAADL